MTTPTGTIKASDIANEFGASGTNGKVSLGAYRVSQTVSVLSGLPLDTGVPQGTAAISFGSLRGKKLNIVVDCTAPSGEWKTKVNARQDYNDNNNITVIGGFKTRPSSPANTKVIIHNNGNIGYYVYLSRAYRGVYCTYDVITGYTDCYTATDYDETEYQICPTPVYERIENQGYGGLHFYSSSAIEIKSAGYTIESKYYIRMFPRQEPGTTLLYRLYNPNNLDHLYTIDVNEWNNSGYNQEDKVGYVYGYAAPSTNPVYRGYKVYNPPSDNCATIIDRLYTFDVNELYDNGFSVEYNGNPAFWAPSFVSDNSKGSINSCSLLTGSWDDTTDLIVDIGSSGAVYGAGGDGGDGGNTNYQSPSGGQSGANGTSAIGINVTNNTVLNNRGTIVAGGGGGGGGGAAYGRGKNKKKWYSATGGGGGGGGGSGYPAGSGGSGGYADGTADTGNNSNGSGNSGQSGSLTSGGGNGSGGGGYLGETKAIGGDGGSSGNDGKDGSHGGNEGGSDGKGGSRGSTGYAIVTTGGSISITGTRPDNIAYNTNPA
jgi:hypothetical protein